jgi:hypothetical protein
LPLQQLPPAHNESEKQSQRVRSSKIQETPQGLSREEEQEMAYLQYLQAHHVHLHLKQMETPLNYLYMQQLAKSPVHGKFASRCLLEGLQQNNDLDSVLKTVFARFPTLQGNYEIFIIEHVRDAMSRIIEVVNDLVAHCYCQARGNNSTQELKRVVELLTATWEQQQALDSAQTRKEEITA